MQNKSHHRNAGGKNSNFILQHCWDALFNEPKKIYNREKWTDDSQCSKNLEKVLNQENILPIWACVDVRELRFDIFNDFFTPQ